MISNYTLREFSFKRTKLHSQSYFARQRAAAKNACAAKALVAIIVVIICSVNAAQGQLTKSFIAGDPFRTAVFIQNTNSVAPVNGKPVLYYSNHDNLQTFFSENGLIFELQSPKREKEFEQEKDKDDDNEKYKDNEKDEAESDMAVTYCAVSVQWIGCNPHPKVEAEDMAEGYYTYLTGEGAKLKSISSKGYQKLTYKDLYPGIDVVYYFPGKGGMEYTLMVHAGADVSKVKMACTGAIENLTLNKGGDFIVHTEGGDLVEHAPVSFSANQQKVASRFVLHDGILQFGFPTGYNTHQDLIVDPWITSLTSLPSYNVGMKVDYDNQGNLFVYGAGSVDFTDTSNLFQVAKYSSSGAFVWAFNGSVPSISWETAYPTTINQPHNYPGGFIVDKVSSKSYISQGLNTNGTQTVRLDANGGYDNFISTPVDSFWESWGILYNCSDGSIIEVGGGVTSTINLGIINTSTTAVNASNISGFVGFNAQDIACAAYDSAGNMYAVMDGGGGGLPYRNTLFKINNTFDGNVWTVGTNFTTLGEGRNQPFWGYTPSNGAAFSGNWINCLAANGSYLFYYDGYNVAAYDFATGAMVGTPTTIAGYTPKYQSGIAVDACNNIYLGGIGAIKTFTFDGSTFAAGADIALAAPFQNDTIHDLKFNKIRNELYFIGSGFIGTCIPGPSIACYQNAPFKVSLANYCDTIAVHVSPDSSLSPVEFTYILFDSAANVINEQDNLVDTVAGFSGLSNGTYFIQVQWAINCGGYIVTDTLQINCPRDSISPDITACYGVPVTLSSRGYLSGGTYTWQPGSIVDSVITVTPLDTTTYVCTYVSITGEVWRDSTKVSVKPLATVLVNDSSICAGNNVVLTAVPSKPGGTFSWVPGGETTASITVTPAATTNYIATYASDCNSPVDTGTITVQTKPVLTTANDTICQGGTGQVSVSSSDPGGNYLWSPGGSNNPSIAVSSGISGNYVYTVTYTLALCTVKDSATLTADSLPVLVSANDTVCQGNAATLAVTPSLLNGTYLWTPGNYATGAISVSPQVNTTYWVVYNLGICTAVDSVRAIVDPMPVLTMANDSICFGNVGQVSVSTTVTGGTYLWSPGGSATATQVDSPLVTTVYTVVYTAQLCSVSGSATIAIVSLPAVSVIGDTVCEGTTVHLTANPSRGNGTYTWAPGGFNTQAVDVTPASTTVYQVNYNIAGCGSGYDSATVKILPVPTVRVGDTAFCQGNSAQLFAVPSISGGVYVWAPVAAPDSVALVSPVITTTYYVTYNLNGCVAADSAVATVYTNPAANVSAAGATCGLSNGLAWAAVSGGTSGYSYVWSNALTTDTIKQLAGNQTYSVTVQDAHQCSASGSANVDQASAVLLTTISNTEKCPGYNNGYAMVTATGGVQPYLYAWSNGQSTLSVASLAPGMYNVTVSDITGCVATASVILSIVPDDIFNVITEPTSCYGEQYHDGEIIVANVNNVRTPYLYSLNSGAYQQTDTFNNLFSDTYNATVSDDSGCITLLPGIVVGAAAEPDLSIYPGDTTLNMNQTVQLIPSFSPFGLSTVDSFYWSPSYGLSCTDCASPMVNSQQDKNNYTLYVIYNGHCSASASAIVNVQHYLEVFIPNAFTPNADGENDVFLIYGNDILSYNMKIFDRWGELMFESNNTLGGWDGTYKGQPQPQGVYLYEVQIYSLDHTPVFKKGSVTLIR